MGRSKIILMLILIGCSQSEPSKEFKDYVLCMEKDYAQETCSNVFLK